MKKISIVVILGLIIFITGLSDTKNLESVKELKEVEVIKKEGQNIDIDKYKDNIIFTNDTESHIIKENKSVEKISKVKYVEPNHYIDIIAEKNYKSINEEGEIVNNQDVPYEIINYASVNENLYVYSYNSSEKEVIKFVESGGTVKSEIQTENLVSNIKKSEENIIITEIDKTSRNKNIISLYDENAKLLEQKNTDRLILEIQRIDDYIYAICDSKIIIYDENLKVIKEKDTKQIVDIETNNNQIYVLDNERNLYDIELDNIKNIKVSKDIIGITNIDNSYIMYSQNKIYDSKNKMLKEIEENIEDIIFMNDKNICIELKDKAIIMKIL